MTIHPRRDIKQSILDRKHTRSRKKHESIFLKRRPLGAMIFRVFFAHGGQLCAIRRENGAHGAQGGQRRRPRDG